MDESWQARDEKKAERSPRQSLMMQAEVRLGPGQPPMEVRVRNISAGGALVACRSCPTLGDRVRIKLRGIGEVEGKVTRTTANSVAIAFDEPIDPALAQPKEEREPVQIMRHVASPRRPGLTFK